MSDSKASPRRHILTAAEIEAMQGVAKVHYLNDNGRRTNKSLGDATGLTGMGVHWVEVPAGADSTQYHRHLQEDECLYVLEGRGQVTLDEQTFDLGPGDFVGMPARGPAHVFHNPGPEPLRCLVIGTRLDHDVADYPRVGKRLFRNDGRWSLVDVDDVVDPRAAPGATVGNK